MNLFLRDDKEHVPIPFSINLRVPEKIKLLNWLNDCPSAHSVLGKDHLATLKHNLSVAILTKLMCQYGPSVLANTSVYADCIYT